MAEKQTSLAPRVHVLDPLVAERIAAGEVIERPSSVVKELVENSLDAGATEITVLLEDGGKKLIEILDNGHGIHKDDLRICIQRHATSKLSTLADLERISTLGFRGEALPSIGGVPVVSGGKVIGAVGCGGGTGEQDHQCAEAGAAAISDK